MYTDECLGRDKNHSCHDEHYYNGDYKYNKAHCSKYNLYCPYMYICPLMNQQTNHTIMQMSRSNYSIKDNLNFREKNYNNDFRHPFGHMSYYYDEHDNDNNEHEHHYNYDNHYYDHEGYYDNYNTYPYVNHDYNEHELNPFYDNYYYQPPYYYQSPFTQYPILPQLPYFEEEEEEHEEHEPHHDNE